MADLFNLPSIGMKYTLRSTGEEVEVIAYGLEEQGVRGEGDWVTYIDSNGKEHIKEHLNIQLDLKTSDAISKAFSNLLSPPKYEVPSTENSRLYETAKGLIVEKEYSVERAVAIAKRFVREIKEDKDEQ